MSAQTLLSIRDLSFETPRGVPLGRNLTFDLREGEVCLISGPNGSGKSTLLKVLLGLLPAKAGERSLSIPESQIHYLPQLENMEFHLPLTLGDVLDVAGNPPWSAIESLRLLEKRHAGLAWNTASGGERKRTLLTRALLTHPKLLVLDEPMNHLDGESRKAVIASLERFVSEPTKGGIVLVSHGGLADDERPRFRLKEVVLS